MIVFVVQTQESGGQTDVVVLLFLVGLTVYVCHYLLRVQKMPCHITSRNEVM